MANNPILNHPQEEARLKALRSLQVLDTPIEERFERLTRLAQGAFHVPICAISCIDRDRVWFKSAQGLDAVEVPRGDAYCQHTVFNREPLVITDTRFDAQYCDVNKDPRFVFYAGAPIHSEDGLPIATLCLIDSEPRFFDQRDLNMLKDFAKLAERELHADVSNQIVYELVDQIDESWRQLLIDPVTRFWNHEGTMTLAGETISQASASDQTQMNGMSLLMIDAANFEIIRDYLGVGCYHQALKAFASELLNIVREGDTIGRISENGFLISLPNVTDRQALLATANRINTFIEHFQLEDSLIKLMKECDTDWSLDATIASVRVLNGCSLNTSECIELLDGAIYQAKHSIDGMPIILDTPTNDSDNASDDEHRQAA